MVYQISIKDVKKALDNASKNIICVVCSENPRMSCYLQFNMKDDGTIYTTSGYQVANTCVNLGENIPVDYLVKKFNEAMVDYDDRE